MSASSRQIAHRSTHGTQFNRGPTHRFKSRKPLGSLGEPFRICHRIARVAVVEFDLPNLESLHQFDRQRQVLVKVNHLDRRRRRIWKV
jgi:hypothetical protein